MNNIITSGRNRLKVSTFNAVQSVKYELLSQKKSSVSMFAKQDFLREKVNERLQKMLGIHENSILINLIKTSP